MERDGNIVGYSSCDYKSLCNYNGRQMGLMPQGTPSMKCQVVPAWPYLPDYNALTHGDSEGGCGGYFGVQKAYNYKCERPIPYSIRPCAGGCMGDPSCGNGNTQ